MHKIMPQNGAIVVPPRVIYAALYTLVRPDSGMRRLVSRPEIPVSSTLVIFDMQGICGGGGGLTLYIWTVMAAQLKLGVSVARDWSGLSEMGLFSSVYEDRRSRYEQSLCLPRISHGPSDSLTTFVTQTFVA